MFLEALDELRKALMRLAVLGAYVFSLCVLAVLRPRQGRRPGRLGNGRIRLMMTVRFFNPNWCRSHLEPLLRASSVERIIVVADGPVVASPKIDVRRPPRLLDCLVGRALARSFWVLWVAWRLRPDMVLGYHVFPAGLSALLAARLIGAKAAYQMTSGVSEIDSGGTAGPHVEIPRRSSLIRALRRVVARLCRHFDLAVCRGSRDEAVLAGECGIQHVSVITGSVDPRRFQANGGQRPYDVAFVGRLEPVKQPDHMVRVVSRLAKRRPDVRVAVAGDGCLRDPLEQEVRSLGLARNVTFLGHVKDVGEILRQSKVYLLTSRSEGLSISMVEAMIAGAVPVVAGVGNLSDLVHNGETGWVVPPGDFETYAQCVESILADDATRRRLAAAARAIALDSSSLESVTGRWDRALRATCGAEAPTARAPVPMGPAARPERTSGILDTTAYRAWRDRVPPWIKRNISVPLRLLPTQHLLGRGFRSSLRFLQRAEWWETEQSDAHRLEHLRRLCLLAQRGSPFYRRVFADAGFDPRGLEKLEDLCCLPMIDRETVQENLRLMCTVPPESGAAEYLTTGGTGGRPLGFYINADRSALEYAHLVCGWMRAGYDMATPIAEFRGRVVRRNRRGLRHEYDPVLRRHYYSTFDMADEDLRAYLDHVAKIGPCYMHVYPSSVAVVARYVRRTGRPLPANVRGILAGSENVYPEQRHFVEETTGVPYFSWYGHSEKVVMAAECERSTDYHVWPTYGCVELLDERDRAVTTPGQRGEIVGTGFINTVMPFIRYRTGDYATYVGSRCQACGRRHLVLRDIRGHRTQEVLVALDGTELPWVALNVHDDTFDGVRQFQFFQDRPGYAVLRIAAAGNAASVNQERIRRSLGKKLDGRLAFGIEIVDSIPVSPQGKAVYVDQRIETTVVAGF